MKFLFSILGLLFCVVTRAQSPLQSGPMVGYSDMREVMLWAQTKQPANVQIRYWEQGRPRQQFLTDVVKP